MAVAITTLDNPYNPLENPDDWYDWDMRHSYSTNCLLARFLYAPVKSDNLPDAFYEQQVENAIDRIVKLFPLTYKKVKDDTKEDYSGIIAYEEKNKE